MSKSVLFSLLTVASIGMGFPDAGSAATFSLNVQTFSAADYATVGRAAYATAVGSADVLKAEDFEDKGPAREFLADGVTQQAVGTSVGSFLMSGRHGSGYTVTDGDPLNSVFNHGVGAFLRNQYTFGRLNTTAGGSFHLDSNDVQNMAWTVALAGGGMFDRLVFNILDAADTGSTFSILVDGITAFTTVGLQSNGNVKVVTLQFDEKISSTSILFKNTKHNDGFGIDDIIIADSPAPVPLPAGGILLLMGLVGLAAVKRPFRMARA